MDHRVMPGMGQHTIEVMSGPWVIHNIQVMSGPWVNNTLYR